MRSDILSQQSCLQKENLHLQCDRRLIRVGYLIGPLMIELGVAKTFLITIMRLPRWKR